MKISRADARTALRVLLVFSVIGIVPWRLLDRLDDKCPDATASAQFLAWALIYGGTASAAWVLRKEPLWWAWMAGACVLWGVLVVSAAAEFCGG